MTTTSLWNRYAAIWSLEPAQREAELEACLANDANYCDPNGVIQGRGALSDYMGGFQQSAPGASFRIDSVLEHNNRSLAQWSLHSADGALLQRGTSFAGLSEDGRMSSITGFFHPAESAS